jgi:hypothetical protein
MATSHSPSDSSLAPRHCQHSLPVDSRLGSFSHRPGIRVQVTDSVTQASKYSSAKVEGREAAHKLASY